MIKQSILFYPQEHSAKRLSYPSENAEIIHAVISLRLQMHQNMKVYLERTFVMWTIRKHHSKYHRDGLNALRSHFKVKSVD